MRSKKTITIRSSPWRFFVILFLPSVLLYIVVDHFFLKKELARSVSSLTGIAIGFLIILITYLPKFNFILSDNWIEGPVRSRLTYRRIRVSYKDIDLARSRVPTIWTAGYLKLKDGRKLFLNIIFLGRAQIRRVMEEVKKRSTK